ncbi:MAG: DUF721 domain-containing protein, partial [Patescibacteria group bacterium]|nr:DUF721 domain-containing protein [Patescibacteria group bacterium]
LEDFFVLTKKILGPEVDRKLKPLYIKEGTLQIACLSTVLAERLKNQEDEIIKALNKPYGREVVSRLKFLA